MKLHHHIAHHVRKHTERIVKHVQKHHKKYLMGAGLLSGMALFKLIGIIAIFFGATYIGGGSIGADYYDIEYYAQEAAKEISIGIDTGCNITGNNLTGITGNCSSITK